jgi:FkbM family methyltransferase
VWKKLLVGLARHIPSGIRDWVHQSGGLRKLRDALYSRVREVEVILPGGARVRVDVRSDGERMFATRRHEPHVVRFLEETLEPGWWVADVGAFIGFYTLICGSLVGESGKVIAFEPVPALAQRIAAEAERNGLSNVQVECLAVGEGDAIRDLWIHCTPRGLGTSSSLDRRPPGYALRVGVTSLDSYIVSRRIPRLDLVKIDVEGSELPVLRGMERTLQVLRPIVVAEFNNEEDLQVGQTFLQHRGYRVRSLGRSSYGVHLVARPRERD